MSAYATAEQFRARNSTPAARDDLVIELLGAASRYLDLELGWATGSFRPATTSSTLRVWPRSPRRVLPLRDSAGRQRALRSWTAVAADYAGAGVAAWTAGSGADWIVGVPDDGDGYRSLRILEAMDGSEGVWPSAPGWVDVTGLWGMPETPQLIAEVTCRIARLLLDSHMGGAAGIMGAVDGGGIDLAMRSSWLWRNVQQRYSAGRPERLGVAMTSADSDWR
ncbi:MAG: hypothetical protein OXG44_17330 [Gammaproteobacteria bacterium]|nr:hypothetical protein [Gammaproteobacteria bacterium]